MSREIKAALLAGLALAALLGAAAFIPAALADGYASYKDEPGYAPRRAARAPSYAYAYTVRTSRGGWNCPAEFARHECRRIQAEIDRRRARETVRTTRVTRMRDYAGRPIRRVEYYPADRVSRQGFGGKRCAGYFSVRGDGMWTVGLAKAEALKKWRKEVRTSERAGEAYMDESYSPNFRVGDCSIASDGGLKKRCKAEGLACRP